MPLIRSVADVGLLDDDTEIPRMKSGWTSPDIRPPAERRRRMSGVVVVNRKVRLRKS